MEKIAVAITCYNNEDEVIRFILDLSKQTRINDLTIIVTCNSCSDIERLQALLTAINSSAVVINPGKNLGYLHGCLYGIKESGQEYDWVLISNTDITFENDNFFEKLLNNIDPNVWCVGPRVILEENGRNQNPFLTHRPSKRKVEIWKAAFRNDFAYRAYLYAAKFKNKNSVDQKAKKSNDFVYALHGSCFMISGECLQHIYNEDANIFMYGEELFIAELIYENDKKEYFNGEATLIHKQKQTTGKVGLKLKRKWLNQSYKYLTDRFFNDL